jgi:hypothetical protein
VNGIISNKLAIVLGLLLLSGCDANQEHAVDAEASAVLDAHAAELQRTLNEGNRRWEKGEREQAVEQYLVVLNDPLGGAQARWNQHDDDLVRARAMAHVAGHAVPELQGLPTAYSRTIDHLVINGADGSARPLIQQALKARINLALTSLEANDVLAEEMTRREQELADAREWLASDKDGGRQSSDEVDTTLLLKLHFRRIATKLARNWS